MNKIDFEQAGGFPLDQEVFSFQQLNTYMVQQLTHMCGPRVIITGCEEVGLNVNPGYVVIDGEVLPLHAGPKQTKLLIRQVLTNMNYEDGSVKPSQLERYVEFGDDGVTTILWADFKRNVAEGVLARLNRLEWLTSPYLAAHGSMVLWRKPAADPLPDGWQEVADWQGRVLMGRIPGSLTGFEQGDQGGAAPGTTGHKMTLGNLVQHHHREKASSAPGGSPGIQGVGGSAVGLVDINTEDTGSIDPDEIPTLDPYRIIMFIEPIPGYIV